MKKYSIIIVAYKAFDRLDKCLDSLFATREDYDAEVIIVDNTPGERTLEEKKLIYEADQTYTDGENHGFAEGCNIGACMAKGEILVFLNPDTEVYGDWIERMARCLDMHDVGAAGPLSNYVAGVQRLDCHIADAPSSGLEAHEICRTRFDGQSIETKLLIGFCLMIRKDFFNALGGMDPALFLGNDDLDLSWRIQLAGKKMAVARDVFVYHYGHASIETLPSEERAMLLQESEDALREKLNAHYLDNPPPSVDLWGLDFFNTRRVGRMTLSVAMIVRNERENLSHLLPQLVGLADEVILVDTSEDGPDMETARELGKGLVSYWYHFPWIDDFAAARNFAGSKCRMDWVLYLDADDRLTPESAALIRAAMDKPGPQTHNRKVCFRLQLVNVDADGRRGKTVSQPRLYPNLPEIQWEGAVHETMTESLYRAHIREVCTDIEVHHLGYADPEMRRRKHERNMRILERMPDSPLKWLHMGNGYGSVEDWPAAEAMYRRILDRSWPEPLDGGFRDHVRYMVAFCLEKLRRHGEMFSFLSGNKKPDAAYLRGEYHLALGEITSAVRAYTRYLSHPPFADPWGMDRLAIRQNCYLRLLSLDMPGKESIAQAAYDEFPGMFREVLA